MIEPTEYAVAGRTVAALIASPDDRTSGAGVLLLHGGSGVGAHERARAAALGDARDVR